MSSCATRSWIVFPGPHTDVICYVVDRRSLRAILESEPSIAEAIAAILERRK